MLGVPGLYVAADPGAPDEHAKQGMLLVAIGKFFEKGLRMGTGQSTSSATSRGPAPPSGLELPRSADRDDLTPAKQERRRWLA
jgi:hypothetical protein